MQSASSNYSSRDQWTLPNGVTYLNHGSFGPAPRTVQRQRHRWFLKLEAQPMDFFLRRLDQALEAAMRVLADWVDADPLDMAFVDNATTGMNIVARSIPLAAGDEVLLTDHEYGAVKRLWEKSCQRHGARAVYCCWPLAPSSPQQLVDTLMDHVTARTRLIVVSHVTSPTAMIVPVQAICAAANRLNVPVCIDGPHAVAMLPLHLRRLGCAFYTASCHKWLSAPFGSGFLYVAKPYQRHVQSVVRSWGRSLSGRTSRWQDELSWPGTRDPSAFLAVPAAIDFLRRCGLERFRQQTHKLARQARRLIGELTGLDCPLPDSPDWYGSMVSLPLPPSATPPPADQPDPLQRTLWSEYRIEVPVITFRQQRFLRVSCHLYNDETDLERLAEALESLL